MIEEIDTGLICECGLPLLSVLKDGKQTGVTHKTIDDEMHHLDYFSSQRTVIIADQEIIFDNKEK